MRWIVFILTAYLFGLGLMPCQDMPMDHDLAHMQQIKEANHCSTTEPHSDDKTGDEEHEHNICSPFCSCACCGITLERLEFAHIPDFTEELIVLKAYNSTYKSPELFDMAHNIWNPPKSFIS
ncbi:hypothetical protein [Aureibacter tunicatorum]|uniref:Uncharacterized protein n=1 Tax=Aureibacter tunicatorum TaxID=866807 RepID=A0AAE4BUQ9_9BACT|nr:hypothetical protein [Aureibacter tunicatorum]MDR6241330.1 hypothetical protein [Aureibacter tunicatorum]BDD03589.1 hypothetical protein AUTU_10720 [Aureibacter tunicatorum]